MTSVKELALVALILCLHSALLTEAQAYSTALPETPPGSTFQRTTKPPFLLSTSPGPLPQRTTKPPRPPRTTPVPPPWRTTRPKRTPWPTIPDGVKAKGAMLEMKGMFAMKGERWVKAGERWMKGEPVFNSAGRVLPLGLLLLPLLGLCSHTIY